MPTELKQALDQLDENCADTQTLSTKASWIASRVCVTSPVSMRSASGKFSLAYISETFLLPIPAWVMEQIPLESYPRRTCGHSPPASLFAVLDTNQSPAPVPQCPHTRVPACNPSSPAERWRNRPHESRC